MKLEFEHCWILWDLKLGVHGAWMGMEHGMWPAGELHIVVASAARTRRLKPGSTLRTILRCNREAQRVSGRGVTIVYVP